MARRSIVVMCTTRCCAKSRPRLDRSEHAYNLAKAGSLGGASFATSEATNHMSELYVAAAKPRVLAIGLTDVEIDLIRPLVGSLRQTTHLYDAHAEEHDVLIQTHAGFHDGAGLFARRIAFAPPAEVHGDGTGYIYGGASTSSIRSYTSARTQFKPAQNLEITDATRELGLVGLVQRSCTPEPGSTYTGFSTDVYPERNGVHILLRERLTQPLALAALLEASDDTRTKDSAFWLPDIARSAIVEWVDVAFARWRIQDPETFPQTAAWRSADAWSSPEEIKARGTLAAFDEAERIRLLRVQEERKKLSQRLESHRPSGDRWRGLVSGTGDDLVAAVRGALEGFGFSVLDADELPQHKGKRREDLRASDGDWTALVEVKGYGGAAKSNDIQQLSAAAAAYAAAESRVPDALWYVVNSYREMDPSQRALPLVGREDDLESFAENQNGCLIDTRDLFTLRQRVALGELPAEDARELLKAATARFSMNAPI